MVFRSLFRRLPSAVPLAGALLATALLAACDGGGGSGSGATGGGGDKTVAPATTPAAPVGNIYEAAAKGHGFTTGNMMAVRQIYVFFDPQCPHCGHLWETAKPLANQVKMVWMPVAFISPKSAPQGAAILAAQDPVATMSEHEKSLLERQGGMSASEPTAEMAAKIKANTELWKQLGGESVPMIIFKTAGSGEPGKFNGAPDTETLKKMLGV